ncbi:TATA box-binding protein-associated factor RNA polymerase I subunit C-like [Musca autumnalis]|uniref:TATA box-binding protein-associated factor RNA polymerase I subunit C-like n=1 Tax=Musca autumnalis TaxID=221902 RepID=UPI003CFBA0E5
MPKRALRFYLDTPKSCLNKINRKRKSLPDEFQDAKENNDAQDEEVDEESTRNKNELTDAELVSSLRKTKQMRCMKYNQNNEIERLLLHNGSGLFYHVDHANFPAFNVGLWPQDAQLSSYPACAISIPRPIFIEDTIQDNIDLCYRRPMEREFHRFRLSKAKSGYINAMKKKTVRAGEKNGIYHTSVYDVAERLLIQPDPYFQASYDYYYTGGNLCVTPDMGNIIRTTGTNLKTIDIMKVSKTENVDETPYLQSLDTLTSNEDCEIFEIQPMKTSETNNNQCFFTRQRNSIAINAFHESKKLKVLTQFRTKSTPFISFTQSDRDCSKLILTTMKQHVRLYDIGASQPILSQLFQIDSKKFNPSWNTIKPWRENTFLYGNEYEFCLIDTRTKPEQWMAAATHVIEHNVLCDQISAIKPSDYNNLFYVATHHKLHCLDIRYMKQFSFNEPEGVICRWSHQLQYPPLMIDTYRMRNNEYIALSSPLAGDLHICQLSRKKNDEKMVVTTSNRVPKHIFYSPCLPYQPPTLLEAYDSARLDGHCLQPEAKLKQRLLACTTGMRFCHPLRDGGNDSAAFADLLTSNSLGDVFVHTLSKREDQTTDSRGNENSNEAMVEFAKNLAQIKRPLNYTDIKNMKGMRKILLCKYLNSDVKEDIDAMDDSYSENEQPAQETFNQTSSVKKKRKRLHLGRWQKSFKTLHTYKDALVADILSIWDIDIQDEKDDTLGNLQTNLLIKPDPEKKVQNWLETNPNPKSPMVVIPPNLASTIYREEVANTTIEPEMSMIFNQTQDTVDFDNVIQSTQIVDANVTTNQTFNLSNIEETTMLNTTTNSLDRTKPKKKTKKYVKGF